MADHGINLPGGTEYPGNGAPPDDALLYIYGPAPLKGYWITVGRVRAGLSGGGTTPTPTPLAVSFSIGSSSRQPGQNLTFSGTANGGTASYSHLVQATNINTGAVTDLGTATTPTYNGVWQNLPAGEFNLTDTVTDNAGVVKVSTARRLTVAAGTTPTKLATPTGLGVTAGPDANGKYTLSWGSVPNASGYQLRQGGSVLIGTGTATSYLVSTGSYEVQALGTGNYSNSDFSAPVTVQAGNLGPVNVYVLTGQSNAEGAADYNDLTSFSDLAALNLTRAFQRFKIYNATTNAIESLKVGGVGVGNQMGYTYDSHFDGYGTLFGSEVGMADTWETNNSGTAYLAKFAWGGRPIADFLPGGQYRAQLDNAVNSLVAKLQAQGYTPIIRGMLWNQWEADAAAGRSPGAYYADLVTLFNSFSWLPSTAKRVITLASGSFDPNGIIRTDQLQYLAATSQGRYLDSRDYERRSDQPIHYNGHGQYLQGKQFFTALAALDNSPPTAEPGFSFSANWQDLVFNPLGDGIQVNANNYTYNGANFNVVHGGLSSLNQIGAGAYGIKMVFKPVGGVCAIFGFSLANQFNDSGNPPHVLDYGFIFNIRAAAQGKPGVAPGDYILQRILGSALDTYAGDFAHGLTENAEYGLVQGVGSDVQKLYLLERLPGATNWTVIDYLGLPTAKMFPQFKLINYNPSDFPNVSEGLYKPQFFNMQPTAGGGNPTTTTYADSASRGYTGTWTTFNFAGLANPSGVGKYSTGIGDTYTDSGTFTTLEVWSNTSPDYGSVEVRIDGVLKSTFSATAANGNSKAIGTITGLSNASHTIEVRNIGGGGANVAISDKLVMS